MSISSGVKRQKMGNSVSQQHALELRARGHAEDEIVRQSLPSYYTEEQLVANELEEATNAWYLIINNQSPHFNLIHAEGGENFPYKTCLDLFYHSMQSKLMEIHPESNAVFKPTSPTGGKSFIHYICVLLKEIHNEFEWNETLTNLTIHHCHVGVRAMEYGILGTLVMHSIKECVGYHAYNEQVKTGWEKIWSKILKVMVPVTVKFELDSEDPELAEVENTMKSFRSDSKLDVVEGIRVCIFGAGRL